MKYSEGEYHPACVAAPTPPCPIDQLFSEVRSLEILPEVEWLGTEVIKRKRQQTTKIYNEFCRAPLPNPRRVWMT